VKVEQTELEIICAFTFFNLEPVTYDMHCIPLELPFLCAVHLASTQSDLLPNHLAKPTESVWQVHTMAGQQKEQEFEILHSSSDNFHGMLNHYYQMNICTVQEQG